MAWNEQPNLRTRTAKTWRDPDNPARHVRHHILGTALHYPTAGLDSEILDGEVDFTFQRITAGGRDIYLATVAGWHYALGRDVEGPLANLDGVVGFGGRQGQHWLKFRLARVGYLHWPTRTWDDIGGAPTYDRADLSRQVDTLSVGPEGAEVSLNVGGVATWADIWPQIPAGALDISWRVDGRQLKEEITVNRAAREWIQANRPPATPASETWFGFVFRIDPSDIPRWDINGTPQDPNGDFTDDDGNVTIRDTLDRLLGFMPVSWAYSEEYGTEELQRDTVRLRKRIWHDPDGNYYLLVGARVDQLNAMRPGAIVFDPTWDTSLEGWGDKDNMLYAGGNAANNYGTYPEIWVQDSDTVRMIVEFDISGIPSDATCDSATLYLYAAANNEPDRDFYWNVYSIASGDHDWPEGTKQGAGGAGDSCWNYKDQTPASETAWDTTIGGGPPDHEIAVIGSFSQSSGGSIGDEHSTVLTAARVQDWFGSPNENYGIVGVWTSSGTARFQAASSDHGTSGYHPKLVVEYTTGVRIPRHGFTNFQIPGIV